MFDFIGQQKEAGYISGWSLRYLEHLEKLVKLPEPFLRRFLRLQVPLEP